MWGTRQGSFDSAGTSLGEVPAPLRVTIWMGWLADDSRHRFCGTYGAAEEAAEKLIPEQSLRPQRLKAAFKTMQLPQR